MKDQQMDQQITAKDQEIAMKSQQIAVKDGKIQRFGMQLQELNQRLVDNEQVTARFKKTNQQLQRQNQDLQMQVETLQGQLKMEPEPPQDIVLRWRDGGEAPFKSVRGSSVVVGNVAYFRSGSEVYSYNSSLRRWNNLPECPQYWGSLAVTVVKRLLTMVGGKQTSDGKIKNKLVSLTDRGKWVEQFPRMPTPRIVTTVTTYQNHLIVAGGSSTGLTKDNMDRVEILNTDTFVWSTAASLPHPFAFGSATIVSDRLYMLGGNDRNGKCRSVFSCSLPELLQSCQRRSVWAAFKGSKVWQRDADIPVYYSTCATVHRQLVAIGGVDEHDKATTAVYKYDPNTRSWTIISHIPTTRYLCYVVAMETTNQLMVVGGSLGEHSYCNNVEVAEY